MESTSTREVTQTRRVKGSMVPGLSHLYTRSIGPLWLHSILHHPLPRGLTLHPLWAFPRGRTLRCIHGCFTMPFCLSLGRDSRSYVCFTMPFPRDSRSDVCSTIPSLSNHTPSLVIPSPCTHTPCFKIHSRAPPRLVVQPSSSFGVSHLSRRTIDP